MLVLNQFIVNFHLQQYSKFDFAYVFDEDDFYREFGFHSKDLLMYLKSKNVVTRYIMSNSIQQKRHWVFWPHVYNVRKEEVEARISTVIDNNTS